MAWPRTPLTPSQFHPAHGGAGQQGWAAVSIAATTLHHVAAMTGGVRLAAVAWVRSLVRDAGRREPLFDLETARRALHGRHGKTPETDLLAKRATNLVRLWYDY